MASHQILVLLVAIAGSTVLAEERKAVALLKGPGTVRGNVTFSQADMNSKIMVEGIIEGLTPGKHGFHIHEKGDLTGGCGTAAGHFNPEKKKHGGPADEERHVGDLGNIEADEQGISRVEIMDSLVSLYGNYNVLGRAVVVHSDNDDLGKGGFEDSLTTGHAGSRVACGVIGVVHPRGSWSSPAPALATPGFFSSTIISASVLALFFV